MAEQTMRHLGPLYKTVGLATDPDFIAGRISLAEKIYEDLPASAFLGLLRAALGVGLPNDMEPVREAMQQADPTFSIADGDAELVLLSSAMLERALYDPSDFGNSMALGIVTAGFGGVRKFASNPRLFDISREKLSVHQKEQRVAIDIAKAKAKPKLDEFYTALEQAATQNNLSTGFAPLKQLIEGGANYTFSGLKQLADNSAKLSKVVEQLREQMEIHWWLLGGWCFESDRSYVELSPTEQALYSGFELAQLTTSSSSGIYSAPALVDKLLRSNGSDPAQMLGLSGLMGSLPVKWRASMSSRAAKTEGDLVLLPLTLAANLSSESNDAEDWKPRYERALRMPLDLEISQRDAAYQMYLERMYEGYLHA